MAVETPPLAASPDRASPVAATENEFPAYRAISSAAVLSLIAGLLSIFCFSSLYFLAIPAFALAAGITALRRIKQFPEILTGTRFANVGMGLALVCALSAVTIVASTEFGTYREVTRFGTFYTDLLRDKPVEQIAYFHQNGAYRKLKQPDEIVAELRRAKSPPPHANGFEALVDPLRKIKERLAGEKGASIHYEKIESKVIDRLTTYANILIEVEGPGPLGHQYAMAELIKNPDDGPNDWQVRELHFPYEPASKKVSVPHAADDGHGH